jgi:predicted thioesterase
MKSSPRIGTTGAFQFLVEQKHCIDFATDGMPAVLSTPNLVVLIERTARESLQPFLEADERTVGTELEIRHLAPTPMGMRVSIATRVIRTEGKTATFQFEVKDEQELIARGVHTRAVIRVESFARRMQRKRG